MYRRKTPEREEKMTKMKRDIQQILRKAFEETKTEQGMTNDLLGLIGSNPPRANAVNLTKQHKAAEIDYRRTTDQMILDGEVVLRKLPRS